MFTIFDFTNYREYLAKWIEAQGERAYGLKGKIAGALGISSSLLSQVMKGQKTLTADQTSELTDYLALNELESDYLHMLVEVDRAASHRYREKLKRKIQGMQEQSRKIGRRVPREKELTDEQKAVFYSSWLYTGVRNLTAVPEFDRVDIIARKLGLEPQEVARVIRFLLENGLCKEESGKLTYGPASTHVDKESPFVNKHHQNWRIRGIQQMDRRRDRDVYFTSPMSLSREAAKEIHKLIPTFIQEVMKISGPSDSEIVACMNLDWFEY